MKRLSAWLFITCVAGSVVAAQDSKVQRGKYLAEEVARCQECHTPRTDTSDFDRTKWMKGATLVAAPQGAYVVPEFGIGFGPSVSAAAGSNVNVPNAPQLQLGFTGGD